MANLIVKVIEAKELIGAGFGGTSDPFVTLTLMSKPNEKRKTRVIKGTMNPEWNEEFEFEVENEEREVLYIQVFDKDLIGKDRIGILSIPIRSLAVSHFPTIKWFSLLGVKQGELHLSLLYRGKINKVAKEKQQALQPLSPQGISIHPASNRRRKLLLTLDGGGVRGLAAAQFLFRLEEKMGTQISDLFDLFAGSAIGSIFAASFSVLRSRADALPNLFSEEVLQSVLVPAKLEAVAAQPFVPKFDPDRKKKRLEEFFGEKKLNEAGKGLIITAFNVKEKKFTLFSSSDDKYSHICVAAACHSSTSPPSYFPSVFVPFNYSGKKKAEEEEGGWFVGGVNNNPAITAYSYSKWKWGENSDIFLLSIGTGNVDRSVDPKEENLISSIRSPFDANVVNDSITELQTRFLFDHTKENKNNKELIGSGGERYLRVNSDLPLTDKCSFDLDDHSEESRKRLIALGDEWFDAFGSSAIQFIQSAYS